GAEERERYRVTIGKDGRLYDALGWSIDLSPKSLLVADRTGALYARDAEEIARDPDPLGFAHSSLLGGEPALMSIEVSARGGVLVAAKNRSGHYRPSRKAFVGWLVGLERQGVDLRRASVSFDKKSR